MNFFLNIGMESWNLLRESSLYLIFGIVVAGFLRVFLSPGTASKHLGKGKFSSVFKAAFLGIPLPL